MGHRDRAGDLGVDEAVAAEVGRSLIRMVEGREAIRVVTYAKRVDDGGYVERVLQLTRVKAKSEYDDEPDRQVVAAYLLEA
jgi:hypothetical protein